MKKNNIFYSVLLVFLAYANFSCSDSTIDNMFTLSMTDRPAQFTLSVDVNSISIDYHNNTQSISVSGTDDWEIATSEDWISSSVNSGTGNGKVVLDIKENMKDAARSGMVRILGKKSGKELSINIRQESDGTPYIRFSTNGNQVFYTSDYGVKVNLEYSVGEDEWKTYDYSYVEFDVNKDLRLRGKNVYGTALSKDEYTQFLFKNSDPVYCTGDIRTLVDYENYTTTDCSKAKFCSLFSPSSPSFRGRDVLCSAPDLPIMELSPYCYYEMFDDCNNLSIAPDLPSVTLAEHCYECMFRYCESLVEAPRLPATNLNLSCYEAMFFSCENLKVAPELPAEELAGRCYTLMFADCLSLLDAPELPAKILYYDCYSNMFDGCNNLVKAPDLPALSLVSGCYKDMFRSCYNLKQVKMMALSLPNVEWIEDWLKFVSSGGLFIKNEEATWDNDIVIPEGWEITYERQNKSEIPDLLCKSWTWDYDGGQYYIYTAYSIYDEGSELESILNRHIVHWGDVYSSDDFLINEWVRGDDSVRGDEDINAYMSISKDGIIKCYNSYGQEIRSSKFFIGEAYLNSTWNTWMSGNIIVPQAGGILWPYDYNGPVTEFEIIELSEDKLVLSSTGSIRFLWRFRATNLSNDKNPCM